MNEFNLKLDVISDAVAERNHPVISSPLTLKGDQGLSGTKFGVSCNDAVNLTVRWLIHSGIQSEEGGFYGWYDVTEKSHVLLYPEITGYGISTLLFLDSFSGRFIFIERAKQAYTWIVERCLDDCGGVRTRLYKDDHLADTMYSFSGGNIFSFDSGMVLYGIVNLFKHTGEKKFLTVSKKIAGFLLEKMQNKDGSLVPIYNVKKKERIYSDKKWSSQPGSFLSKVATGLVDLFILTKEKEYRDAAIRLCEYALTKQDESGRFITDSVTVSTHLHAHCYSIEGLLYTGVFLEIAAFVEAAKKATSWIFDHYKGPGIGELFEIKEGRFNGVQRIDAVAQALRLGVIFQESPESLDSLARLLLKYQYLGCEKKQIGGFAFSNEFSHINSWCSMFSLQALSLYRENSGCPLKEKLGLFI